jgi:hypothetical protein
MTDRELLEAAAKAAGMTLTWGEKYKLGDDIIDCTDIPYAKSNQTDESDMNWNPLTDDGDALRLAVKLQLHVGINPGNKVFCTPTYSDKPTVFESCERSGVQDPLAATRRAIVRAAAEIGRNMA